MYVSSQSTAHIPASLSSSEKPPELFPKNIASTSRLETTATLGKNNPDRQISEITMHSHSFMHLALKYIQ